MKPFRKYELVRRGSIYYIYRMTQDATGSTGDAIFESSNYQSARRKLYELNGWKWQGVKN